MTEDSKSQREAAVADAGPLIHLDELSCLKLLDCYTTVWIPRTVSLEAQKHRPGWQSRGPSSIKIVDVPRADVENIRMSLKTELDAGELESLALWKRYQTASIVCDDLAARRVAKEMGAPIIGTLGLIIKAARQGRIDTSSAIELIRSIPDETTLHVRRDLLQTAVSEIERRLKK
jgi:predicted nucleic acid-binding protein